MNWSQFTAMEPDLAALGREAFGRTGLALVGTLRRDGWPRISPVEPVFLGDDLYLGMMWRSVKALDLLRDPRCTVHSTVSDREGGEGEFKLYGIAIEATGSGELAAFCDAVEAEHGWRPPDSRFHCFALDLRAAAHSILDGEEFRRRIWQAP